MQTSGGRVALSIAPILPPALRRWAEPLDPAINRLLIPDEVARGIDEARRSGSGAGFARRLLECLDIDYEMEDADLARVPAHGAAVAVCNHPHGVVEGLILVALLDRVRADYKLVANSILSSVTELRGQTILVDPFETAEAHVQNRAPLRQSLAWLAGGGLLGMFPAGEVAHLNWKEHAVTDPPWKTTAARLALHAGCPVVPVLFEGANSMPFQLAGALHPSLRTINLVREFHKLRGRKVRVRIGNPIPNSVLSGYRDAELATEYLRSRTYFLANRSAGRRSERSNCRKGRHTADTGAPPVAWPVDAGVLANEVDALPPERELASSGGFSVYLAGAAEIPSVLHEIGRCREVAFRAAGEGTGKALDIDRFDDYYQHLFLWSKADRRVAGAYRLVVTTDVIRQRGIAGLYTSTLFRIDPRFFARIGPAVELGRSFVVPEYQKNYTPLLLLWKAIMRFVVQRSEGGMLFGAVSISRDYRPASRGLIAAYLSGRASHPLSGLVHPRTKYRDPAMRKGPIRRFAAAAGDLEDLSLSIADIEDDGKGVPVLVRQYLRVGGRVLGFNLDPDFSDALDALILTNLREAPRSLLERCIGRTEAQAFLQSRAGSL